jgi:arylsulfatase
MKLCITYVLIFVVFTLITGCYTEADISDAIETRPNILLIVADDLGYTDLTSYGGEINTPYLTELSKKGMSFTSFYSGPTCSPARSMMLTGVDSHRTGFGTMHGDWADNQLGLRGYEGHLNHDVVTFPKLLEDSGYHTSIVGKWHLSSPKDKQHWPINRGFTRSFTLAQGGAGHFDDMQPLLKPIGKAGYVEDDVLLDTLPKGFYSSKYYADKAIEYISESQDKEQAFFHFLSFTAPHWPLQVPDEFIDLYKGKYDNGYETLMESRLENAKGLGIIPENTISPSLPPNVMTWTNLPKIEKLKASRSMEIYAAMVERMDYHIGRVIQFLKNTDSYDNTLIIFLSDNGAEGNSIMGYINTQEWVDETFDNSLENMGRANSYVELGTGWASASSTPFKWYKAFTSEGGMRVPVIIKLPSSKQHKQKFTTEVATVLDIAPTCLDIANVSHPGNSYEEKQIFPMTGKSMIPFLVGDSNLIHSNDQVFTFELFGRRGIRKRNWKAEWLEKPYGKAQWELYDLDNDPSQEKDLAKSHSEILNELMDDWSVYLKENNVTLPDRPTAYATEKFWRMQN